MNIKNSWLAVGLITAMTGCIDTGSDSDTDSTDSGSGGGGGPATVERISFSGLVADGYLDDARVCLDINENKKCDVDDPTATSGEGGAFTIDDATQEQRDTFALLVEVVKGVTIDEDNAGVVLTKDLTLSAPAGYGFISPLSTMVQSEVEGGSTPAEAEEAVQEKLGTDLDLDSDYIAGKASGANAAEYEQLHQVAQVTARVISENIIKLQAVADDTTNNISIEDLISAIVNEVFEALDEITEQVEEIAADPEADFDPDTVAQAVDEEVIDLETDTVVDVIEQDKAQEAASSVDMSQLLLEPGLTWFWAEKEGSSLYAEYGTIYNDAEGNFQEDMLVLSGSGFISQEGSPEAGYILKATGWEAVADFETPDSIVGGADGTITITKAGGAFIERLISTEVDLEGLNTRTVMNIAEDGDGIWGEYLQADATFPLGSKGYTLADNGSDQAYVFEDWDGCNGNFVGGLCSWVYVQNGPLDGQAQSFADITSTTAHTFTDVDLDDLNGITGVEVAYSDTHKLWAEIVTGGVVNYYKVGQDHSAPDVSFLGASTWSTVALSTAAAIELVVIPEVMSFGDIAEDGNVILGLIAGYIRQADLEGEGGGNNEPQLRLLNQTAAGAVTGVHFSLDNLALALSAPCTIANTNWARGDSEAAIFSTWTSPAEFEIAVSDCLVANGVSAAEPFVEVDVKDVRVRNYNEGGSATYLANNKGVYSGPEGQQWFDWSVINERLVVTYTRQDNAQLETLTYVQVKRDLTQAYSQSKVFLQNSGVTAFATANSLGELGHISSSAGELSSVVGTAPPFQFVLSGNNTIHLLTVPDGVATFAINANGTGAVHWPPEPQEESGHPGYDDNFSWTIDAAGRALISYINTDGNVNGVDRLNIMTSDGQGVGTVMLEIINENGLYQNVGTFPWSSTVATGLTACTVGDVEWDAGTDPTGATLKSRAQYDAAITACLGTDVKPDIYMSRVVGTTFTSADGDYVYTFNGYSAADSEPLETAVGTLVTPDAAGGEPLDFTWSMERVQDVDPTHEEYDDLTGLLTLIYDDGSHESISLLSNDSTTGMASIKGSTELILGEDKSDIWSGLYLQSAQTRSTLTELAAAGIVDESRFDGTRNTYIEFVDNGGNQGVVKFYERAESTSCYILESIPLTDNGDGFFLLDVGGGNVFPIPWQIGLDDRLYGDASSHPLAADQNIISTLTMCTP